jgi:serine/threonine-protein kinase
MDNVTRLPTTSWGDRGPGPEADLTGKTLGDFQILRRLGKGGMGQVYLAEQVSLRRRVALKIMRPDLAANATSLKRFQAEAEAVARATHANIVQVYAIGEADSVHYMALEYVDGRNLRDYLARKGPPDVALAVSIMCQVADALQRASELGVIHRDIKPENILLTRKGEVKVADFGLSRCLAPDHPPLHITQSGVTLGTPLYMSPEQVEGKTVDPRTDIYSFGVTCYHMLAGHPPFRGQTAFEVSVQHVQAEPVPLSQIRPDLPPELCAVVHKMMAKKPDQRYQSGRELRKDLARLRESLSGVRAEPEPQAVELSPADSQPLPAPVLPAELPAWPPRGLARAAVLTIVLGLVGGAVLGWHRSPPPGARLQSQGRAEDAGEVEALLSEQKREQFLITAVNQYGDPGGDPTQLALGLGHRLELGLVYLQQWRLAEADEFFKGLINNPPKVPAYHSLGRVGGAMVLAFQNRPEESNRAFLKLLVEKWPESDRLQRQPFLFNNPRLREMIARALNYNHANATPEQPFPERLQPFRKAPVPRSPLGPDRKDGQEAEKSPPE